jgi:hypothetical protein
MQSKTPFKTSMRVADRLSFTADPQSGKTEMMICLTAKLLDIGHKIVIHLLNDSVQLLGQNLGRFQRSGLAPAAKNSRKFWIQKFL